MRHVLIGALIVLVYLIAYRSVRTAEFVYEDFHWIGTDAEITCCATLTQRSFAWQRGASSLAHHGVNVVLHLVLAGLVGAWLLTLHLPASAAWIGVAVMLWQPLAIESVAYVSGRSELIAAILVMLGCIMTTYSVRGMIYAVLLGVLAGFGKESGLVGLALMPLALTAQRLYHRACVLLVLCVMAGGIVWTSRTWSIGLSTLTQVDPMMWLRLQAMSAVRLIGMVPMSIGQTVAFDVELTSPTLQYLAIAWLGLLCVLAMSLWSRFRYEAAGLLWILTVLAPRMLVQTPESTLNEHQFLLALPGVALIVASVWTRLAPRGQVAYG